MGNLQSFQESHVTFRNKGNIGLTLGFEAFGQIAFSTGTAELFGSQNFGSAFTVPGLITVGPTFKVLVELRTNKPAHVRFPASTQKSTSIRLLTPSRQGTVDISIAQWDYRQRYPNPNNDILSGIPASSTTQPLAETNNETVAFYADVSASGDVTIWVKPLFELGVVLAPNLGMPEAAIDLELDTYATLYGTAAVGTDTDASVCYGANAGIDLFAAIQAPTLFGINLSQKYSLFKEDFDLITQQCWSPTDYQNITCDSSDAGLDIPVV